MSDAFKLLVGSNSFELDTIVEQDNKTKERKLYIEGIFGEAGIKNKNGRVYDVEEMRDEIKRYNEECIATGRAFNELNHPSSPDIDLERVCDRTVSLRLENDGTIIGKSLVCDTPLGRIQKGLIDGGGKIGKSSRALGQISEASNGTDICDYVRSIKLVCFDSVQDPSVGRAIVDPLLEQKEWIIGDDGGFLEKPLASLEEAVSTLPRQKREEYFVEAVSNFLKSLRA